MTFLHSFNSVRFDDAAIFSDNAVFYLMGKAMLQGKVLYKDMFDHKAPYIYFINAIASIFDKRHVGLYIITSLVLFVALYFTYKIVNLFIKDKLLSIVGAAFICLFLNNANLTLGFLRTEGYAVSLLLPSAYLFIKYFLSDEKDFPLWHMFIIGILAGITLLINVKAAVLYLPFAIATLVVLLKNKNYKNIILCFISGLFGVIIAVMPAVIYLIKNDCVKEAMDAIVGINAIYSNYDSAVNTLHEKNIETILTILVLHPVISIIMILELVSIIIYKTKKTIKYSVLVSFIFCLAYTIILNRPYTYYYTIIIPYLIPVFLVAISKFIGTSKTIETSEIVGASSTSHRIVRASSTSPRVRIFSIIAILIMFVINFPLGFTVTNYKYESNLIEKEQLYERLGQEVKIDDNTRVLAYGFSPEYYMYLNKKISFKYFIIPNITFKYYSEPYLRQIEYIRESLPDILVFAFGNYTNIPTQNFNEFREAVDSNYKYLGDLNIFSDTAKNPKVLVRK